MLYVNVPKGVHKMAVCFTKCENRSDFTVMRHKMINDGQLPVFYIDVVENVTTYKLKLIFPDQTEGDTDWINMTTVEMSCKEPQQKQQQQLKEMNNIFILSCFTVSSLCVILLKILRKCIRNRVNEYVMN